MKPAPFAYHRAESIDDALDVLERYDHEAKILAGGQSLLPVLNYRLASPPCLIDICRIPDLDGIVSTNGVLEVGAAARQRDVELDAGVAQGWPLLVDALGYVGHPQVRNRGTVCGSLAHADPASELCAAMVALDAEMVVRSRDGVRTVPAAEFFQFHFTTALEDGELLEHVRVPAPRTPQACAFLEVAARPGDFAFAGVAVSLSLGDGDTVEDARVVAAGVGATPLRVEAAETVLVGRPVGDLPALEARHATYDTVEPSGDARASAGYRRRLCAVLTERAVHAAALGASTR